MRPLVTDGVVARDAGLADGAPSLVLVAAAATRGRREATPAADAAVAAIDAAGAGAIALAPAGSPLGPVARLMGADVVALPADECAAAWVLGVALRAGADDDGLLRRLEGLASAAGAGGASLARTRPAVLLRWAGWAWRRCAGCAGGGVAGGPCGRCGARVDGDAR
ncbi:MAG: hypothetical protein AB7O78_00780 [Thermoleophilia bacterium]